MKQYTTENLVVKPDSYPEEPGLLLNITPESAGWQYISFQVRTLAAGNSWRFETGDNELALVNLSGKYTVESNRKLGKNTIGPFSKQCDSWFSHRTGNGL